MKIIASIVFAGAAVLAAVGARAADNPVLMEPVKSVYTAYTHVQAALANDSLDGVAENAKAISKAVQEDSMKMLPSTIAQQAERVAGAKNVQSARAAFRPLSNSLIAYLIKNNVTPGDFYEVYCPMAKAAWLQTDKAVKNPYMGKAMVECGQVLPKFTAFDSAASGHEMGPGHQHQM